MSGSEAFQVPATDVPAVHYFVGGLLNTAIFRNLSTVSTAFVVIGFQSGGSFTLFAGETLEIEAEDTSTRGDTGKIWGSQYEIRGDAVNAQDITVLYTTKAPHDGREDVTV